MTFLSPKFNQIRQENNSENDIFEPEIQPNSPGKQF